MFSRANINANQIRAKLIRPRGTGRRRSTRRMRGHGFFGNLWSGIKKAANWVKKNRIISKVAGVLPGPIAKGVATAAGAVGLGRRRRRTTRRRGGARMYIPTVRMRKSYGGRRRKRTVRRRRGGSFSSFLSKAHKFVKGNRLVSKGLRHFGFNTLARGAHAVGYGRKRRRTVRRRVGGRRRVYRRRR